jgi:chromosome partitioning protein
VPWAPGGAAAPGGFEQPTAAGGISLQERSRTVRVIALVNQKGGCGKTTTAVNLAACLALNSRRVLLVDFDPQANATISLGADPGTLSRTVYQVIVDGPGDDGGDLQMASVITPSSVEHLDLVPSSIDLASAELELSARIGRENTLRKKLAPVKDQYDYVLIDTPPSLGLLTLNALVACQEAIIPIQTHYYALLGMRQLLRTIKVVRRRWGMKSRSPGSSRRCTTPGRASARRSSKASRIISPIGCSRA